MSTFVDDLCACCGQNPISCSVGNLPDLCKACAQQSIDRLTQINNALLVALEGLIEHSQHMSPFGGAGTVSDVRKAGKYMAALDKAKAASQKARERQ